MGIILQIKIRIMKKKIYKISLLTALTIFCLVTVKAQDAGSKKNVLGAGVGINFYYGIGGNLSYYRMITPKLGIGARAFLAPLEYPDYLGTTLEFSNGKGLYSDISVGATYYILGNSNESKFNLYSGLALGFIRDKGTQDIQFAESNTPFQNTDVRSGFSGNLTIGAAYKVGPGKFFLEWMPSTIITGKDKNTYKYPTGSLIDANGNAISNTGFVDYEYNFKFSGTYSMIFGYQISF